MKSILKSLSEHGTFIQPDALNYISSKEKPKEFASLLIKNLQEYPLVLTVDHIKNIEQTTMIKEPTKPETSVKEQVTEDKEIQKWFRDGMIRAKRSPLFWWSKFMLKIESLYFAWRKRGQ